MKLAVLTSGGDAPGMNAAIRAITRTCLYGGIEVYGVQEGFKGLCEDNFIKLQKHDVSRKLSQGGTFLATARYNQFHEDKYVQKAITNLKKHEIDCLAIIGGEGSYKGANKLVEHGFKVFCIPATIDNDIASTQLSIGFDTASNTIIDAIDKIKESTTSHHRCSIIEVMGRSCADLAYRAGIGVGAEKVIVAQEYFSYDDVCEIVKRERDNHKQNIIIVVVENLCNVIELASYVEMKTGVETRSTILGYIQRGGSPSALDRYLATAMGAYLTKLIDENIYNVCLGTTGSQIYYTELEEALRLVKETDEYLKYLDERLT